MTRRRNHSLTLEALEVRRNPAITIVNSTTATFTDVDGDLATVKVSAGTLTAGMFTTAATGLGDQLQTINLSGGGFDGADLTIAAKKGPTGDGQVNVGFVNSTNHDLGNVRVAGDLGQIDAGDADTTTAAIKALSVRSMGRFGLDTQSGGSLGSNINGPLGTLKVSADFAGVSVNVTGAADGTIGSIQIGGSVVGGTDTFSGYIFSAGAIGPVTVGHDVQGGSGTFSGTVESGAAIGSVTVRGSVVGGGGTFSGYIQSGSDMGSVTVGHDLLGGTGTFSGYVQSNGAIGPLAVRGSVVGGSGTFSGYVQSNGAMGPVAVRGSVVGGSGTFSGYVQSNGAMGPVAVRGSVVGGSNTFSGYIQASGNAVSMTVGHNVVGGSGTFSGYLQGSPLNRVTIGGSLFGGRGSQSGFIQSVGDLAKARIGHDVVGGSITGTTASLDSSGFVRATGRIGSLSVGGSIISGSDTSTAGSLTYNGSVRAGNDIGSLKVRGSLIGNSNPNGDSPVIISARGQATPGTSTDVAIGKVAIGGRVEHASILAGYDVSLTPKNADAQVGAVTVGGDWIRSNIAAGVIAGGDGVFGTGDDAAISGAGTTNDTGIASKIAGIKVRGLVYGTPAASGADHFGFVAEEIGSFKSLGFKALLDPGINNDVIDLAPTTLDVTIREVA